MSGIGNASFRERSSRRAARAQRSLARAACRGGASRWPAFLKSLAITVRRTVIAARDVTRESIAHTPHSTESSNVVSSRTVGNSFRWYFETTNKIVYDTIGLISFGTSDTPQCRIHKYISIILLRKKCIVFIADNVYLIHSHKIYLGLHAHFIFFNLSTITFFKYFKREYQIILWTQLHPSARHCLPLALHSTQHLVTQTCTSTYTSVRHICWPLPEHSSNSIKLNVNTTYL